MKAIVTYCSATRCVFAHALKRKGAGQHVIQCIVDDIAWLGHTRLVLRSDNEPAMVALIRESLEKMCVQIVYLEQVAA